MIVWTRLTAGARQRALARERGARHRTLAPEQSGMLARLERDSLWLGGAGAAGAFLLWPGHPHRALGVLAGLLLVALAYAGIRAGVDAAIGAAARRPEAQVDPTRTPSQGRAAAAGGFVKFFTRHAILAAGAYVMIARFELHPVAMLAGVTTPVVAAAIEFVRIVRARGTGSHSRSS